MKKIYLVWLSNGWIRMESMIWLNKQLQRTDIELHVSRQFKEPVQSNRNSIALDFLKSDCDYLVMIDSDTIVPNNFLELIDHDKDIISATYCGWHKTYLQFMAFNRDEKAQYGITPISGTGLKEADYLGTGAMIIKREVIENIKRPFDCTYNDDGIVTLGEDFSFCEKAREKGYKMWVDLDCICSHYKEINLEMVYNYMQTKPVKVVSGRSKKSK